MVIVMHRQRVICATGTIGLVMDCDTTVVEPDFALVKFKKLSVVVISRFI
jgi:ribonucleotide reductase alpha subunit